MNISITFRHMEASEAIKSYARDKLAKLQKFLRKPMTAKVTLSLDKLRHVAETRISSGGEHLEAKETSEDMYASIDRVLDKLERQIRGSKGAARAKKRRGADSLRVPTSTLTVSARGDGATKRRARTASSRSNSRGR
jgi:putative sigma-54 modulation protein